MNTLRFLQAKKMNTSRIHLLKQNSKFVLVSVEKWRNDRRFLNCLICLKNALNLFVFTVRNGHNAEFVQESRGKWWNSNERGKR